MKAKIKDSGRIVDVAYIGNGEWRIRNNTSQCRYAERELEFLDNVTDWSQVRIQAAIAAMQGILSDEEIVGYACSETTYKEDEKHTIPKAVAQFAVACANALIIELKEKGGQI